MNIRMLLRLFEYSKKLFLVFELFQYSNNYSSTPSFETHAMQEGARELHFESTDFTNLLVTYHRRFRLHVAFISFCYG